MTQFGKKVKNIPQLTELRKETNDWKENEERDLCCENKEGNFIKMESGGQRGVEGAFMQYHSLSMTGRIVKVSRRKESLITGPQQENMYIAPPQLEKNHVGPPSSQDEALARSSVSREVPRSVLKCKTILAPLMRPQKFLDILKKQEKSQKNNLTLQLKQDRKSVV